MASPLVRIFGHLCGAATAKHLTHRGMRVAVEEELDRLYALLSIERKTAHRRGDRSSLNRIIKQQLRIQELYSETQQAPDKVYQLLFG